MCGIIGVVQQRETMSLASIEYARDLLHHRGPDGFGLWTRELLSDGGRVVLGHRRLSILDLSERSAQPLLREGRAPARPAALREESRAPYALVYNGEIYNYVELREELRARGHAFRSTGDSEVLLAAYAEWGAECVARLNGMFAFAIWDERRLELFCARDRFGEKPFYYVSDRERGVFAFASEVKALVGAGAVVPDIDPLAVYRFLRFGEQAGVERTMWRGVRRLLPGHTVRVSARTRELVVHSTPYWVPSETSLAITSEEEAAAGFAELFRDSVRIRLRSDVPIGTSLSGGIDSSSIICQIHAQGAARGQKAFTARTRDRTLDEGPFVDVVLRRTGIPGYAVVPDAATFLEECDRLFFHQEEPFFTTSIFASYLVHRLARDHGVTVMLDGQGADEYLAGYAHYPALVLADLARRGRFGAWWRERGTVRRLQGTDPVPPRAALALWLDAHHRSDRTMAIDAKYDVSFLTSDLRTAFADEVPRHLKSRGDALATRMYADLMHGHLQELLRYADRNSMAFSREVRLPFLDHRLVEYSLSLPTAYIYGRGQSKRVLRRAMKGVVPDEILARGDKVGFVSPWDDWWHGSIGVTLRERVTEGARELSSLMVEDAVRPGSREALVTLALASVQRQLRHIASPAMAR